MEVHVEAVDERGKVKSGRGPSIPPDSNPRMLTRSAASVRGCVAPTSRGEPEAVLEEDDCLFERMVSGLGKWTVEDWTGALGASASILHLRRLVARLSSSSAAILNAGLMTAVGRDTGEIGKGV